MSWGGRGLPSGSDSNTLPHGFRPTLRSHCAEDPLSLRVRFPEGRAAFIPAAHVMGGSERPGLGRSKGMADVLLVWRLNERPRKRLNFDTLASTSACCDRLHTSTSLEKQLGTRISDAPAFSVQKKRGVDILTNKANAFPDIVHRSMPQMFTHFQQVT